MAYITNHVEKIAWIDSKEYEYISKLTHGLRVELSLKEGRKYVYRNAHEVHWRYNDINKNDINKTLKPGTRVAIESNIHSTGSTFDVETIAKLEIFVDGEQADEFCQEDMTCHPDFCRYYDTTQKRNIWLLGYYGGGSVNISDANHDARQFAQQIGVPFRTVRMDEILSSRRFKGYKFLFSDHPNQEIDKNCKPDNIMDNAYQWLRD